MLFRLEYNILDWANYLLPSRSVGASKNLVTSNFSFIIYIDARAGVNILFGQIMRTAVCLFSNTGTGGSCCLLKIITTSVLTDHILVIVYNNDPSLLANASIISSPFAFLFQHESARGGELKQKVHLITRKIWYEPIPRPPSGFITRYDRNYTYEIFDQHLVYVLFIWANIVCQIPLVDEIYTESYSRGYCEIKYSIDCFSYRETYITSG